MLNRIIAAPWCVLLIAAWLVFTTVSGTQAEEPMEDVDYVLIEPQAVADPRKIEVIEFFYYGCDSCSRLEPQLRFWLKTLSNDTSFRRVPALRRTAWAPLTKVYFALEELGEIERLHNRVYQAVHDEGLNLADAAELRAWAQKAGLDGLEFERILDSNLVRAQVQRARDVTVAYGIRATPSFVVDGRYMTSGRMTGNLERLLPVVDGLIGKARDARAIK